MHPRHHLFVTSCRLLFSLLSLFAFITRDANAAPTVSSITPLPGSTVSSLASISITFSEPVTGVQAEDLAIGENSATVVTGSGAGPYNFTFTQPLPGSVVVDWVGDQGIAGLGTGAFAPTGPWTYTLNDVIAPVVVTQTPTPGATVTLLNQVEVTFSEEVTGVDAGDLTVNGISATSVSGTGAGPYLFGFAAPSAGVITFAWSGSHGIKDTATPANNFPGGTWDVTLGPGPIGSVIINEFLASNGTGLADENGDQEDWIELRNTGATPVNLLGWALTNEADSPGKWVFPNRTIAAGGYLVVFASGKDRRPASGTLHTNFQLNENGGTILLLSPELPRTIVSAFDPFPEQRTNFSYGRDANGQVRYFSSPSPNAANPASSLVAITPTVNFNVARGFFKDPFQLVLSCSDSNATIRYTTDYTEPTAASPAYSTPINVTGTVVLRAVAFSTTKIPSLPVTHTYIFLDQVATQSNTPSGFPTNWGPLASFPGGLVPADYGMDTDPLRVDPNNAASPIDPVKQQRLSAGLRELPMLSVTIPIIDMFGVNGLYYSTNVQNKSFGYKKCAVEMVLPDGSTAFTSICGITGHGNASREPLKNPKHGFQLKFKGDFGDGSLAYKLFTDSPVEDFDDIILRPDFNSSWRHWSDDASNTTGTFQRTRATRLRDAFLKDTFRAMGGLASYHRFVNLYINGLYWGTFDYTEQPVEHFAKSYLGGDKADYAIIHEGVAKNGNDTVYTTLANFPTVSTNAQYEQIKGLLDAPEFIDYTLLHFYTGHQDWGNIKNWYAIRRRASVSNPSEGKYQYIPWDQECTMLDTTINRVSTTDLPTGLHPKLVANAQYRLDFADRVHKHMIAPGGALTSAMNVSRWQKWQATMDNPIVAESCRWGDYRRDVHQYSTGTYVLYTRENQWLAENNRLVTTYFPGRSTTLLSQLQSAQLYPAAPAPEYRKDTTAGAIVGTSIVPAGYVVALKNPSGSGTVYYTTDGNDPHIYYTATTGAGASTVAASAQVYTTPLTISSTTTIKSRVLNASGIWSALNEATFSTGLANPQIRFTEIMYNPPGGAALEYIELSNAGIDTVDLSGWYMNGINFYFPFGTMLNPGARIVLANNDGKSGAFATNYPGVSPTGWYSGSLDNSGERISLFNSTGSLVTSVTYDDENGWPTAPDGGIAGNAYSLEIIDPTGNPDEATNWKASNAIKGSPGQANSPPPATFIELSEVLAKNSSINLAGFNSDFVELHNIAASPADLSGWSLSNDGNPRKFTFPGGTTISADGYLTVLCDTSSGGAYQHTGFVLNGGPKGDKIQLYNADSSPVRMDAVSWGNQVTDKSIGRVSQSWVLNDPTPDNSNVAASLAAASGSLFINEWFANPQPGKDDWFELYNGHATNPVALRGLHLKTSTQLFQITSLSFIPAQGFIALIADQGNGADHVGFKLDASGITLSILGAGTTSIDTTTFGPQVEGVSEGRLPDGSASIVAFPNTPSPGSTNYADTYAGPVINEVLARNVGADSPPWGGHAAWFELHNPAGSVANLDGIRVASVSDFASSWPIPANSSIAANGYLQIWCDPGQPPSNATGPALNTGFGLGSLSGGLYLFNSAGQLVDFIEWGPQLSDKTIGLVGNEWMLLASPTPASPNSVAQTLGPTAQLRINEWAAALTNETDWIELYNLDSNPVALAGLYLTDDPSELGRAKYTIAPLSFVDSSGSGRGWVKLEADGLVTLGANHLNFALSGAGEYLRLSGHDASFTLIDSVSFGLQSSTNTSGRILDGGTLQLGLTPTPGSRNILPPAPTITQHPGNESVAPGGGASFMATATGSAPLSYQWRKNGIDISGATLSSLSISGADFQSDAKYDVVVTNTAGSAVSQPAFLMVQATFAEWQSLKFSPSELSDPLISGMKADPDGDGIVNIQEYLHDTDPKNSKSGDWTVFPRIGREPETGSATHLTLTYRRSGRLSSLNIQHKMSVDLASGVWNSVSPESTENLGADPTTGDPIVRLKFPVAPNEPKNFLRLELQP